VAVADVGNEMIGDRFVFIRDAAAALAELFVRPVEFLPDAPR
jgi:hypothetical protein